MGICFLNSDWQVELILNLKKKRIGGTVASSIYLMMQGVQILRIHDVNEIMQGIKVFKKIINN